MKSNVLIIVLIVFVGAFSGISLLGGINNAMRLAIAPVDVKLNQISQEQREILQRLNEKPAGADAQVLNRLTGIEKQLTALQNKVTARAPAFAPPQPPSEDFNKVYNIDIGSSPINGKKDAPITIVEFTDLQCPFCARFYPPLKEVLKAYPDKVKVVVKNFPLSFHPNARPAAKLALAANEQGKYYEMIDLLLQNGADASEAKAKEYAKTLNLNQDRLIKDLKAKDAEYEKRINDDTALGGQVDVQGTPTFFINGKKTMARDFNGYKTEIDKLLANK